MNNNKEGSPECQELRQKAEAIFDGIKSSKTGILSPQEIQTLIQELHIHQIELDMQNDELRQSQKELLEAKARYFDLYELAPIGYFTLDKEGVILLANVTSSKLLNIPKPQLINYPFTKFILPEDQDIFYKYRKQLIVTTEVQSCELRIIRGDGQYFWAHINATVSIDVYGNNIILITISDFSERKKYEETIKYLADYDTLTELPNRRLLRDRIEQAIIATTRTESFGAIMFVDIDHFKTLNDTYGHSIGDLLLTQIASRLHESIRESDTAGRQGGDEFIVLLNNLGTDIKEAAAMAKQLGEKLREVMETPFYLNDLEFHCEISIGITLLKKGDNMEKLLRQADRALYKAKEAGRNTVCFFDPES